MSIAVCGIGIVSAIGIGAGETLESLRTGRSGIVRLSTCPWAK